MLTFISCAKTMTEHCPVLVPETTEPQFQEEAVRQAVELGQLAPDELGRQLRVNPKLAAANALRYCDFLSPEPRPLPALGLYSICQVMSYFSAFISLIEANGTSFPCVKPAPAFSALSFTARVSTSVMPYGTATSTRGLIRRRRNGTFSLAF